MVSSNVLITAFAALLFSTSVAYGWGPDGHVTICKIAEAQLTKRAAAAVSELLQDNDFVTLCTWADEVKNTYPWSKPLHYVDTPDHLCTYEYDRDCKDENGVKHRCVVGAIKNYTNQLVSANSEYNLTEALLFLSGLIADIHLPLNVGFTSDAGGSLIDVYWYNKRTNLHHVWSDNIIETELKRFYDSNVNELADALIKKIKTVWANQVLEWRSCPNPVCPDVYANEGVKAACDWAYKGVHENSILGDHYFLTRYPVVNIRLAQAGVRLATTLNTIFITPLGKSTFIE